MAIPDSKITPVQVGELPTADKQNQIIGAINELWDRLAAIQNDVQPGAAQNQVIPIYLDTAVANEFGWFQGRRMLPPVPTAHIDGQIASEGDIGTKAVSYDCYVIHQAQIAIASPKTLLKTGVIYDCCLHSFRNQLPVYRICGGLPIGETASPTTLSGTGTTADTSTWARASDGTPLTETYVTRVAYDTTAHVFYQFTRTRTVDACGIVLAVSAETRSTVDSLVSCS